MQQHAGPSIALNLLLSRSFMHVHTRTEKYCITNTPLPELELSIAAMQYLSILLHNPIRYALLCFA
jgi:hypothetical protein